MHPVGEFFKIVGKWWYLVGAFELSALGLFLGISGMDKVPEWGYISLALIGFVLACFIAFYRTNAIKERLEASHAVLQIAFQNAAPYIFDNLVGERGCRFGIRNRSLVSARKVQVRLLEIAPSFVTGMVRSPTGFQADFPYTVARVSDHGATLGACDISSKDEELFLMFERKFRNGVADIGIEGFDTKENKHILLRDQPEPWEWRFVYRVTGDNCEGLKARFRVTMDYGVMNCELLSVDKL